MKSVRMTDGVLTFEVDPAMLETIERALGSLKSESRRVLKNAVNATAAQARKDLAAQAKKAYTAKKSALTKAMKKKNATVARPVAVINITGQPLELKQFKVTAPRSGVKAKVLTGGALRTIQSLTGTRAKAFVTKFSSGHVAVVQRQDGKQYKTLKGRARRRAKYGPYADMTQIKKLMSVSAPKMIGDVKRVYGVLQPTIYRNLMTNIRVQIDKVVREQ